jgi:hypothetical protein
MRAGVRSKGGPGFDPSLARVKKRMNSMQIEFRCEHIQSKLYQYDETYLLHRTW